jgi:hypothetical protein
MWPARGLERIVVLKWILKNVHVNWLYTSVTDNGVSGVLENLLSCFAKGGGLEDERLSIS